MYKRINRELLLLTGMTLFFGGTRVQRANRIER
jgi:hypothetical protein